MSFVGETHDVESSSCCIVPFVQLLLSTCFGSSILPCGARKGLCLAAALQYACIVLRYQRYSLVNS